MRLNSIGTGSLEVRERPERVADQCLESRRCKEVKVSLNSISTRILEVCLRSESVADNCFESGRVQGVKNET